MTDWIRLCGLKRSRAALAAIPASLEQGVSPLAQVEGDIPDEHVVTVRERRVSVDYPTIIQDNMATDTLKLDLDGEWDGMQVLVYVGYAGDLDEYQWKGQPITLPVYSNPGSLDVTVVGMSDDGKIRLVTAEAKDVLTVIRAGEHDGSVPEEDRPDLLAQILAAKEDAEEAAQTATSAASSATAAASSANGAATGANSAASAANAAAANANSKASAAQTAAEGADEAAADALAAAQEARDAAGAISEDLTFYFSREVIGDKSYIVLHEEVD